MIRREYAWNKHKLHGGLVRLRLGFLLKGVGKGGNSQARGNRQGENDSRHGRKREAVCIMCRAFGPA